MCGTGLFHQAKPTLEWSLYRYHFLSRIYNKHDKHSATTYGLNLRNMMLREQGLSVLDYWTCSQFDELQTDSVIKLRDVIQITYW